MLRPTLLLAALAAAAVLAGCSSSGGAPEPTSTDPGHRSSSGPTSFFSAAPSTGTSPGPSSGSSSSGDDAAAEGAARQIRDWTRELGSGGASVMAVRTDNGTSFRYGATGGMATASIAKLFILETLLLQHQESGTPLSDVERDEATRMIENSDNAAADALYSDVDTVAGLNAAGRHLGVHNTVPGTDYLWGFTTTCAADYIALLRALIAPSALSRANRLYAIGLLKQVESDQRWGVSAAADPGSEFLLKNGWLPSDPDQGRWIVNSVGVVTVHGHQVLLAVLTQHGASFDGGIDLVEKIAKRAANVVA